MSPGVIGLPHHSGTRCFYANAGAVLDKEEEGYSNST